MAQGPEFFCLDKSAAADPSRMWIICSGWPVFQWPWQDLKAVLVAVTSSPWGRLKSRMRYTV